MMVQKPDESRNATRVRNLGELSWRSGSPWQERSGAGRGGGKEDERTREEQEGGRV